MFWHAPDSFPQCGMSFDISNVLSYPEGSQKVNRLLYWASLVLGIKYLMGPQYELLGLQCGYKLILFLITPYPKSHLFLFLLLQYFLMPLNKISEFQCHGSMGYYFTWRHQDQVASQLLNFHQIPCLLPEETERKKCQVPGLYTHVGDLEKALTS